MQDARIADAEATCCWTTAALQASERRNGDVKQHGEAVPYMHTRRMPTLDSTAQGVRSGGVGGART